MTNNIVTVNVTQTVAPTPSQLQKTGALISIGATTLDEGTYQIITEMSDLDVILVAPSAISTLTWQGTAFVTSTVPHGFTVGETVVMDIAGNTPSEYDASDASCLITGPSTFQYEVASDPGPLTVAGTFTPNSGTNSTLTWSAGTVTVTTSAPHGLPTGSIIPITIAGVTPSGYNTAGAVCTVTGASTFTYPKVSDPGAETVPGTWAPDGGNISAITWHGQVTATTVDPHGYASGLEITMSIAGTTPAGYSGTYDVTITGASTFTYILDTDPGSETVPGTYSPSAVVNELTSMARTFFAQGSQQAVYVLELGAGSAADGVAALSDFIDASPQFFYSYLVPRDWADSNDFIAFVADFEALTAKTYFFVTVTADNYTNFTDLMKCVFTMIEAPATPATEFSCAAPFHVSLNYDPSQATRVTPFAFSYLFGVTRYPTFQNGAFLQTLKTANVNWVGVGTEGGISNAILFWGHMMDGRPFNYWYSVDWVQINGDLDISNAVINGSNNPANPLYYNQNGINRLQAVVVRLMNRGIAFGLVLGDVVQVSLDANQFQIAVDAGTYAGKTVVNAVPFIPYSQANPGDYKIGKYGGLYVAYVPLRGFEQIIFNINVSDFVSA